MYKRGFKMKGDVNQYREVPLESQKMDRQTYSIDDSRKESKKIESSRIVYIVIIIVLILIAYLINQRCNEVRKNFQRGQENLQEEVRKLKNKQHQNEIQLHELQTQVIQISKKSVQIQKQTKSYELFEKEQREQQAEKKNQISSTNKIVKNNQDSQQKLIVQQQSQPQQPKQKGGTKKVAKGTVQHFVYFHKISEGKKIEEVLYTDDSIQLRKTFNQQRIEYISKIKYFQSYYLATFNNKIDNSRDQQQQKVEDQQYKRIDQIWNFEKYPQQLPICVIIPSYNNNAKYRIQYNLNSIFQQNYSNYFVVIINDASTDGSGEIYKKYLDFYQIDKSMYIYVQNPFRLTALQNYYNAVHKYCSSDSIAVGIDGDDELIGKNVLKIFNAAYQKYKAGVIWSNFYWYDQGKSTKPGFTSQYTQYQKESNSYRSVPQRFSHLRTFRCELFLKIDKNIYFTDQNGNFFRTAYDVAMIIPMLQLSCGRNVKIQGYHYLYNFNTGLNDHQIDRTKQSKVDTTTRSKPMLKCSKQFDEKMKNIQI